MPNGKINRAIDTKYVQDPCSIEVVQNNPSSGGKKTLPVGPKLLPIPTGATTYTTTPNTGATALPLLGLNIGVYNNSSSVASIVIGGSTIVTLAAGVTDSSGNVGVPCTPNAWTYLSMGYNQYIITSTSTLLVFIVEDPTSIIQETGPYAQQNAPIQPRS